MDDVVQAIGRQHGFVGERAADTQQQARYRQQCNGQHKAASHALQHAKDLVFHLQFSFSQVRIQHIYPHRKDLWRIKGGARKLTSPSESVSDGS